MPRTRRDHPVTNEAGEILDMEDFLPRMTARRLRRWSTPDKLLAAIRARGSDADDLRDAAHEACHALDAGLEPPWSRNRVHEALLAACRGDAGAMTHLIGLEIRARAVERVLCEHFGVAYDLQAWANTSYWETTKTLGVVMPSVEWLVKSIDEASQGRSARSTANQIRELR